MWQYDRRTRRYHDPATGRFLGHRDLVRLRDTFTDRLRQRAAALGTALAEGKVDVTAWEGAMRELVKAAHIDLAALGKGGRAMMGPADWGRVGRALRDQYAYLERFADETPNLSAGQIAARSGMYVSSSTASYERARAAGYDVTLPAYPGEDSECLVSCRCSWSIVEVEGGVEATWQASGDDRTCPTCTDRAAEWNPLFIATGAALAEGAVPVEAAA